MKAIHIPLISRTHKNRSKSDLLRNKLIGQQAASVPTSPMMAITTIPAGSPSNTALIRRAKPTGRTNSPPLGKSYRDRELMTHTDLKLRLGCINCGHPSLKIKTMNLFDPQH